MTEKLNIYQRISAIQGDVSYVQKDKAVSTGGGSYKAVSHDAVTALVRQHQIKHGVVVIPNLLWERSLQKEDGSKQFRHEAGYRFRFQNIDDKEDFFECDTVAHAMDNADKAPGKCFSYAKKYALLKVYEIESGEDEESRYQQEEYDFAAALTRAEAASKELAREILKEAKQKAVVLKDAAAIKAVDAVGKKLATKFAKETEGA